MGHAKGSRYDHQQPHGNCRRLSRLSRSLASAEATIFTDSRRVIDGLTKWIHSWRRRGWKKTTADTPQKIANSDVARDRHESSGYALAARARIVVSPTTNVLTPLPVFLHRAHGHNFLCGQQFRRLIPSRSLCLVSQRPQYLQRTSKSQTNVPCATSVLCTAQSLLTIIGLPAPPECAAFPVPTIKKCTHPKS